MIVSRLLRFLTLIAVLAAPLLMLHGSPVSAASPTAMVAVHAEGTEGGQHCADMEKTSADTAGTSIDCQIACAVTLAVLSSGLNVPDIAAASPEPVQLRALAKDVIPEVTPPPPRDILTI